MNNPFSASRNAMCQLYVDHRKRLIQVILDKAYTEFSRKEVEDQVSAGLGPVVQSVTKITEEFSRRTENVEFITALGLSDFYFGAEIDTEISFEMRRDFGNQVPVTYENLINNIESATHIDFSIAVGGKTLNFQIKRYPQACLNHTNDAFLKWLGNDVLPHYANMTGTILIILLQPNTSTPTAFRFPELSTELENRQTSISFDEIAVSYTDITDDNKQAVLHKLYPNHQRVAVPLDWFILRLRG